MLDFLGTFFYIPFAVKEINGSGVKAAGGIKDYDTAVRYLDLGCTRLGVGATVDILEGAFDIAAAAN